MVLAEHTGTGTITYLHGLDLVAQSDGMATENGISPKPNNCGTPVSSHWSTSRQHSSRTGLPFQLLSAYRNNWQTEGQVNRPKFIKRQIYGRAQFDLLRVRIL